MNVTDFQEVWQIDAGGQIYEARFEEMAQWVFEGSLLPQDMVKRGNLRWIEARKVPALLKFFNDHERGLPPPVFTSMTDGQSSAENPSEPAQNFAPQQSFSPNPYQTTIIQPPPHNFQPSPNPFDAPPLPSQNFENQTDWQETAFTQQNQSFNEPLPHEFNLMPTADFCSMHPDAPAAFLCGTCGNGFCPACPKSYGGTVKICPFCGAMCKSVKEVQEKTQAAVQYSSDISKGFGAEDFFKAFAYPFKFKTSLFFGAVMFMFFSLGQGAVWMGNIFLIGAGLMCWMLTNMLTFGVLANTVENFAQGKVGGNFMPSFDDFSLWDDVVHPFFLSVGVYLVSFGLVIAIIIGTIIWGLNQVSKNISQSYAPADNTKILTDKDSPFTNNPDFRKQNEMYGDGEMPDENGIIKSQTNPDDTEENVRRTNDLINQQRKKQLESGLGKSPETVRQEQQQMIESFLKMGLPILILIFIGFLWGIFYFPAACCVAGYTRSFAATLNPTVGLETIKLLGWDYVKIWFMGFTILISFFIVGMILGVIFMAFDMPAVGNIPAKAIGAMFGFYFSIVFSVILGFALYKNADKLNLFKG
ncbi:MAG TPA: hypothetical protein VNB22_23030 [Pyrinomonadaceae bacterium]|nr:hypothetical protein [Pyrinomonadaceae bacterium]